MKRILTLLAILSSVPALTLFDNTPWLHFENDTPTDLIAEIHVRCDSNKPLTLKATDIAIKVEQEDDSIKVGLRLLLPANQPTTLNPIFFNGNEEALLPEILSVSVESPIMQTTYSFDMPTQDHRHFTINLDSDSCLALTSAFIPMSFKFKSAIKYNLLAVITKMKDLVENI